MAYQPPITIKEAIDNIRKRHYVLPSIQREFVWDTDQIETLFDSLMRDYPISTFLFWKVDKSKIKNFQFYEFLKVYHEKDGRHNPKADLPDNEDVIALLDGQQRMTSMFIALTGSHARRLPHARKNNPAAYPVKKMYLNLLKKSDELEVEYDFKFLTVREAEQKKGFFWFPCSEILDMSDMSKTSMYLMKNKLMDTSIYSELESEFAINTLNEFFNVVHQKGTISYYLEKGEELDKVLQIFIRINSGGTKLSYSDLLLSIATAQWKGKDAREIIHSFVDEINKIGDGFSFNKDLVLKACLVLSDFDVKFKVDNFTKENMEIIEQRWESISDAIRSAVDLFAKFGYSRDNLLATNTVIPISYFIYKNQFANEIVHSSAREADRKSIKEWLARVLLKGTFGGQPDSIYPAMRDLTNKYPQRFPLDEIIEHYKSSRKSITFSEDEIENLLELQYSGAKTYCVLTLLYPGLNFSFKYHQDHIHPKSFFSKRHLKMLGLAGEKIDAYLAEFNCLPNLQLLQATTNIQKSDKSFHEWMNANFNGRAERESFLMQNHIGPSDSLEFDEFLLFIQNRKQRLKHLLQRLLVSSFEVPAIVESVN
ncbi:DUF262 domain-containing protein [Duganella hordei]|uniref:DUF262 domain-containing protein n=1 Tax=Duganella hordei TaxID=2865934 RepID=UPI0030E9239F